MKLFRKPIYFYFGFLFLFFIACDNNGEDQSDFSSNDLSLKLTASSLIQLDKTDWVFTNYSKNKFDNEYENKITLTFDETDNQKLSFSGNSLINSYVGTLLVEEGTGLLADFQDLISTMIGSNEPKMTEVDLNYYNNLTKATYYKLEGDNLLFYLGDTSKKETEIMIFTRS